MEPKNNKHQRRGVSLKLFGWIISTFVLIISATLVVSLVLISNANDVVNEANNNYTVLKQSSNDVQLASDYLTAEVRLFVANADKKYMDAYFEEANVTKRRETALEKIHQLAEKTNRHEEIHANIATAINESMDLMNLEYYAMKLVCVDKNISYAEYPEVGKANIESIAPEDRQSEAFSAVLGNEYVAKKDIITHHIDLALEIIDELIKDNQLEATNNLKNLILFQSIVIGANGAFVIAVIFFLLFFIIKPMDVTLKAIEDNEEVHTFGSLEFNYVVAAYNEARSQNEKVKEKLIYEAEHDKLTNLYNRTGYVSLYRRMQLDKTLYVLIDVDDFKEINDKYGHDIGDRVLSKLAGLLKNNFDDDNTFIFRIGGDEFAVLIEDIGVDEGDSVVTQFERINTILSSLKGAIPPFTLSIGIAHGDEDDTTDSLFKKADNALYKVKQSGKSGVVYDKNK